MFWFRKWQKLQRCFYKDFLLSLNMNFFVVFLFSPKLHGQAHTVNNIQSSITEKLSSRLHNHCKEKIPRIPHNNTVLVTIPRREVQHFTDRWKSFFRHLDVMIYISFLFLSASYSGSCQVYFSEVLTSSNSQGSQLELQMINTSAN